MNTALIVGLACLGVFVLFVLVFALSLIWPTTSKWDDDLRNFPSTSTMPQSPGSSATYKSPITFTMWVKERDPHEALLIALLHRIHKENLYPMPEEFKHYLGGDRSYNLSYRVSPNHSKGGSDVLFKLE